MSFHVTAFQFLGLFAGVCHKNFFLYNYVGKSSSAMLCHYGHATCGQSYNTSCSHVTHPTGPAAWFTTVIMWHASIGMEQQFPDEDRYIPNVSWHVFIHLTKCLKLIRHLWLRVWTEWQCSGHLPWCSDMARTR